MDTIEIEWHRKEVTEQVRSSFYSLNILVDTFIELAKNRPGDNDLRDAIRALRYTTHELFNRITVMKIWDQMGPDVKFPHES